MRNLVGLPRFELGTSCTPSKRATRLRHSPTRKPFYHRGFERIGNSRGMLGNPSLLPNRYQASVNFLKTFQIASRLLGGRFWSNVVPGGPQIHTPEELGVDLPHILYGNPPELFNGGGDSR
jgi:hypothetical protein